MSIPPGCYTLGTVRILFPCGSKACATSRWQMMVDIMNYYRQWLDDIASRPSVTWKWARSARGECRRHTGPSIWFAGVQLELTPSDEFVVDDKLESKVREYAQKTGWYDQIVFGVYDVLMIQTITPFRNFKLSILAIDFNHIESNAIAFRLAGRDAAKKLIEQTV